MVAGRFAYELVLSSVQQALDVGCMAQNDERSHNHGETDQERRQSQHDGTGDQRHR